MSVPGLALRSSGSGGIGPMKSPRVRGPASPTSRASGSESITSGTVPQVDAHPPSICMSSQVSARSRGYMDELCIQLNLHGLLAFSLPSPETDRRRWFRERVKTIQASDVYIAYIDVQWIHTDEPVLELYYALRSYILTGSPIVIPVFDQLLVDAPEVETERIRNALTPSQQDLISQLMDSCASLVSADQPKDAAIQVFNLLAHLGLKLPKRSFATGHSIANLYCQSLSALTPNKPNSGLMRILSQSQHPSALTQLNLSKLFIADLGTIALSTSVLNAMPCLLALDLSMNGITAKGVNALCKTVKVHPSLASVDLSDNTINQAGASEIFFLLEENHRVTSVNLNQNPIYSDVWARRIHDAMERNKHRLQMQLQVLANQVSSKQRGGAVGSEYSEWMVAPVARWRIGAVVSQHGSISINIRLEDLHGETVASHSWTRSVTLGGSRSAAEQQQAAAAALRKASLSNLVTAGSVSTFSGGGGPNAQVQAAALQEKENAVFDSVYEFFNRDMTLCSISVQRLNGKQLQFLIEAPDGRSTAIATNLVSLAGQRTEFKAALQEIARQATTTAAGPQPGAGPTGVGANDKLLHRISLRLEDMRLGLRSNFGDSAARGATGDPTLQDAPGLLLSPTDAPISSCFVERELALWRSSVVSVSFAQLYRWQIGSYAGNLRDEVSALLEIIANDEDAALEELNSGAADGAGKRTDERTGTLAKVVASELDEEAKVDAAVSKTVLKKWTGSGPPPISVTRPLQ